MNFDRKDLSNLTLIELYKKLLKPRMIEEKISMSFVAKVINDWMHFLIRIRELLVNSDPDPTRPIKLSNKK